MGNDGDVPQVHEDRLKNKNPNAKALATLYKRHVLLYIKQRKNARNFRTFGCFIKRPLHHPACYTSGIKRLSFKLALLRMCLVVFIVSKSKTPCPRKNLKHGGKPKGLGKEG
jgi:hypothetical protein